MVPRIKKVGIRNVLKNRLIAEENQTVINCNQLKMLAKDGGGVAGRTRKDIEEQGGKKVISAENNRIASK